MMTRRLLMNILLMLVWVALTGSFAFINFGFGFLLSFLIMWVINLGGEDNKYFTRVPKLISFIFFFLWELLKANLEVAYDVITPKFYMTPGIVRLPIDNLTDMEITLLANLITLTPGTLSLDVSDDKKVLYVHSMYIEDKEKFIRGIKNGFEKRMLEITR
jgi:multicomponent Na+:H+ antiporter subunit E